ncbi:hypothetical protein N9V40_00875 [Pseudomonadales bacterium]|nr:hypothetical protein [Pseudomonadales bacterium]
MEQEITTKNNDNIAIFIAGAFALGLLTTAMYFMTQRNEPVTVTPEPVAETLEQLSEDAGIDFSNLVAVPVEEAEQGADVTDSVTPELQADNGSN